MLKHRTKSLATFNAASYRVGIVVAQFNTAITEQLLATALAEAKKFNIPAKQIVVHRVAGSVEIPAVLQALAQTKKFDALVALGAIIRGETPHFEYVAKIVSEDVLRVTLDHTVPVGFGVLTCENEAQAKQRLSSGASALAAAVHSARVIASIKRS